MNRALAMDRVPAGRVGKAVKLGVQTHFSRSFLDIDTKHPPGGFPGGSARGSPDYPHIFYNAIFDFHLKFGGAKPLAIVSKTVQPWQSTSGGRRQHPFV